LERALLPARTSLATRQFLRGAEKADEVCCTTSDVPRGEMNAAMVGFLPGRNCTGHTLMQFVAVTYVAYNVLRLPTAREPTVRAAKGCPPPFTEADYPARGGQRPKAATRQKRVR
jgi:hypothetical protein